MINKKYCISILIEILILLMVTVPVLAETGLRNMLNLTGARQSAMGEMAMLAGTDPFNLEYNSSSITGMSRGQLGVSYNSFIQNRNTSTLAMIFPAVGADFGMHLRLSSIDDIEARDETPSADPLYTFTAHDFAIKAYGAYDITDQFSAGLSLGYLLEKIDIDRVSTIVMGLSSRYKFNHGITAHASVENLGGKFKYISKEMDAPTIIRIGSQFNKNVFGFAVDYVSIKSGESHIHLGAEYLYNEILYLRAGYQTGYDNKNISAGSGFVYRNLRIDYAFIPFKSDLGNSHRFSLILDIK
ncbi:MAG: PorV/PorQ family protein [candidate division Zixibacteria bacterium]